MAAATGPWRGIRGTDSRDPDNLVVTWRDYPLLWEGLSALNRELSDVLPMLVAPEADMELRFTQSSGEWRGMAWGDERYGPVHSMVRRLDDRRVACFVVGFPAYGGSACFGLGDAVAVKTVSRWPCGDGLDVEDNGWTDHLNPGQAQVYVVELAEQD